MIKFTLDSIEEERFNKFKNEIKEKYGKYGQYEFIFYPTSIGVVLNVKSMISYEMKDITNYDNW